MAEFFQDGCQMVPDFKVLLASIVKWMIEVCNVANIFLWGAISELSAGHDKIFKMADIFKDGCQLYSHRFLGFVGNNENSDRSLESGKYVTMKVLFQKNVLVMIKILKIITHVVYMPYDQKKMT